MIDYILYSTLLCRSTSTVDHKFTFSYYVWNSHSSLRSHAHIRTLTVVVLFWYVNRGGAQAQPFRWIARAFFFLWYRIMFSKWLGHALAHFSVFIESDSPKKQDYTFQIKMREKKRAYNRETKNWRIFVFLNCAFFTILHDIRIGLKSEIYDHFIKWEKKIVFCLRHIVFTFQPNGIYFIAISSSKWTMSFAWAEKEEEEEQATSK